LRPRFRTQLFKRISDLFDIVQLVRGMRSEWWARRCPPRQRGAGHWRRLGIWDLRPPDRTSVLTRRWPEQLDLLRV